MHSLLSLLIGYVMGSVSPAALLCILKHHDLHREGTGNLGATNTMLVMGKKCGVFVMVFDILKSFFAARLARLLFPQLAAAALLGSLGAVLGHIFSMFLRFHGGKGVAAFGGMILAYDPMLLIPVLTVAFLLMLAFNYGVAGPISAGILFPLLVWADSGDPALAAIAGIAGFLMINAHRVNLLKIRTQSEQPFRPFILARLNIHRGL